MFAELYCYDAFRFFVFAVEGMECGVGERREALFFEVVAAMNQSPVSVLACPGVWSPTCDYVFVRAMLSLTSVLMIWLRGWLGAAWRCGLAVSVFFLVFSCGVCEW